MNNIFDIKRFVNYFAYDLRRAGSSYGISLLVLGLMPVILLVLHMLGSLFSSGSTSPVSDQAKFTVFCVVVFVTTYLLILPAISIEKNVVEEMPGVYSGSTSCPPHSASVSITPWRVFACTPSRQSVPWTT